MLVDNVQDADSMDDEQNVLIRASAKTGLSLASNTTAHLPITCWQILILLCTSLMKFLSNRERL